MPFLEFLLALIVLALLVVLAVGALIILGGLVCIIAIICYYTGWIPIVMCVTDPNFSVGVGFVGIWALASLCVYGVVALEGILVLFLPLNPAELPDRWKFLEMYYSTPIGKAVTAAKRKGLLDHTHPAAQLRFEIATIWMRYSKKMRAWQFQQAAKNAYADADYMNAQADLHRAAEAYNRAKLRVDEAKRARYCR